MTDSVLMAELSWPEFEVRIAAGAPVLIPLGVAWARVYQGMHFLTDVTAGIVLGAVSLTITHRVLRPHEPDDLEPFSLHAG